MVVTPPTVNAYYDPANERDQFSGRSVDAAALRSENGCRAKLRQYGRHHRPRTHHGFDDEGRQYDAKATCAIGGRRRRAGFRTARRLRARSIREYVIVDDIHINSQAHAGRRCGGFGRHVAGLSGLEACHGTGELAAVDGLKPDQRFFVGMAQWACGDDRPEQKRINATVDFHSRANSA